MLGFYGYPPEFVNHVHAWQNSKEPEASGNNGIGEGLLRISIRLIKYHGVCRDKSLASRLMSSN